MWRPLHAYEQQAGKRTQQGLMSVKHQTAARKESSTYKSYNLHMPALPTTSTMRARLEPGNCHHIRGSEARYHDRKCGRRAFRD
jgi:hypothetical protein